MIEIGMNLVGFAFIVVHSVMNFTTGPDDDFRGRNLVNNTELGQLCITLDRSTLEELVAQTELPFPEGQLSYNTTFMLYNSERHLCYRGPDLAGNFEEFAIADSQTEVGWK